MNIAIAKLIIKLFIQKYAVPIDMPMGRDCFVNFWGKVQDWLLDFGPDGPSEEQQEQYEHASELVEVNRVCAWLEKTGNWKLLFGKRGES